jgi:anthranilate phosphoribosyltransferase
MDVLEALGVPIDLDARKVEYLIATLGIGFMLAPKFHPALAHAGPVRREIGFRTTFNFLGPLANPAFTSMQVLGVSDRRRAPLMIEALRRLGSKSVLVVHGEDGLDELTLSGSTFVHRLANGAIEETTFAPSAIGVSPVKLEQLFGGDREHNARVFRAVLDGSDTGPIRDLTALNAGAGFFVAGRDSSIAGGFARAKELLASRAALTLFERYKREAAA